MKHQLAESIRIYFDICNGADTVRVTDCFTTDAVVSDEGHQHRGTIAVQSWLRDARRKFEFRVEPVSVSREGKHMTVVAEVVGNFPGSPVTLNHSFQLQDNRIQSLEVE